MHQKVHREEMLIYPFGCGTAFCHLLLCLGTERHNLALHVVHIWALQRLLSRPLTSLMVLKGTLMPALPLNP
jgi:hypothetical protein